MIYAQSERWRPVVISGQFWTFWAHLNHPELRVNQSRKKREVTNDPMMIMCLMALAFFGNGFASITWSLVSSLAPMRLIGLTGGVFNFAGGLGGITVPLVVGYLAQGYGFAPALVYISAVALIGALSYILLVGDVNLSTVEYVQCHCA